MVLPANVPHTEGAGWALQREPRWAGEEASHALYPYRETIQWLIQTGQWQAVYTVKPLYSSVYTGKVEETGYRFNQGTYCEHLALDQ